MIRGRHFVVLGAISSYAHGVASAWFKSHGEPVWADWALWVSIVGGTIAVIVGGVIGADASGKEKR